jgi:hypothetical protein
MRPLLLLSTLLIAATLAARGRRGQGADSRHRRWSVRRRGFGRDRFVTLPSGASTIVAAVRRRTGEISSYRRLRGRYTIPAVAYDGTAGGLSPDGHTLVLTRPRVRFPRAESSFLVLDTRSLRPRRRLTLTAEWSFDAISPDGRYLYLIEYTDPRDTSRYAVRLYDLTRGRLAPEPIVDPHEADEAMRGSPLTRVSSPDGRWEYTLYDGGGEGTLRPRTGHGRPYGALHRPGGAVVAHRQRYVSAPHATARRRARRRRRPKPLPAHRYDDLRGTRAGAGRAGPARRSCRTGRARSPQLVDPGSHGARPRGDLRARSLPAAA